MFIGISNIVQEGLSASMETWAVEKKVCCRFSIIDYSHMMDLEDLESNT